MSSIKCKSCDGWEVDVDPTRGDAICTDCGTIVEAISLVDEIQYEQDLVHGGNKHIGQFVSSESNGGATYVYGGKYERRCVFESRNRTLKKARKAVNFLAQQLNLNEKLTDIALNFYKLALMHNFTRGRKHPHLIAACVYLTCRTEATAHLLIDCSDVLQVSVYALGRTYLQLSQALHIRIPTIDPCLYVLRFANRLEFGEKTRAVTLTALRLVQRMKKDGIHTGRRPSGLCGAALLIAARMHNFSRTVEDIVKIVRVHQTTLRKRLLDYGETPSSSLTLDEFATVDLEEVQDPPSFKAARVKEKDELQKVIDNEVTPKCLTELQKKIEMLLNENKFTNHKNPTPVATEGDQETSEARRFEEESVASVFEECLKVDTVTEENETGTATVSLGPSLESLNLVAPRGNALEWTGASTVEYPSQAQLTEGIEDDDIDSYIMSTAEADCKRQLWNKVNVNYLQAQKEKEENAENSGKKTGKKRRKTYSKKIRNFVAKCSADEAINKMLASISSINDFEDDSEPDDSEISLRQILCAQREDFPEEYAEYEDDY